MVEFPVKELISPNGLTFSLYSDFSILASIYQAQRRGREACFVYIYSYNCIIVSTYS